MNRVQTAGGLRAAGIKRSLYGLQGYGVRERMKQVDQKFQPGKNPLELEDGIRVLQPTTKHLQQKMIEILDQIYLTSSPQQKQALELWKFQLSQTNVEDQVKFQFIRRFYYWLLGRGEESDHKKTLWGRGNAAIYNGEVSSYIDAFLQKRKQFAIQLSLLRDRVPSTLVGYWLYFKYIVNGELKLVKMEDGTSFWDMSDENFLQDFDLFAQLDPKAPGARGTDSSNPDVPPNNGGPVRGGGTVGHSQLAAGLQPQQNQRAFEGGTPHPMTRDAIQQSQQYALQGQQMQQSLVENTREQMSVGTEEERNRSAIEHADSGFTSNQEQPTPQRPAAPQQPHANPPEMDVGVGSMEVSSVNRSSDYARDWARSSSSSSSMSTPRIPEGAEDFRSSSSSSSSTPRGGGGGGEVAVRIPGAQPDTPRPPAAAPGKGKDEGSELDQEEYEAQRQQAIRDLDEEIAENTRRPITDASKPRIKNLERNLMEYEKQVHNALMRLDLRTIQTELPFAGSEEANYELTLQEYKDLLQDANDHIAQIRQNHPVLHPDDEKLMQEHEHFVNMDPDDDFEHYKGELQRIAVLRAHRRKHPDDIERVMESREKERKKLEQIRLLAEAQLKFYKNPDTRKKLQNYINFATRELQQEEMRLPASPNRAAATQQEMHELAEKQELEESFDVNPFGFTFEPPPPSADMSLDTQALLWQKRSDRINFRKHYFGLTAQHAAETLDNDEYALTAEDIATAAAKMLAQAKQHDKEHLQAKEAENTLYTRLFFMLKQEERDLEYDVPPNDKNMQLLKKTIASYADWFEQVMGRPIQSFTNSPDEEREEYEAYAEWAKNITWVNAAGTVTNDKPATPATPAPPPAFMTPGAVSSTPGVTPTTKTKRMDYSKIPITLNSVKDKPLRQHLQRVVARITSKTPDAEVLELARFLEKLHDFVHATPGIHQRTKESWTRLRSEFQKNRNAPTK